MLNTTKAKVTSGAVIPLEHLDIKKGTEVTVSIQDTPLVTSGESRSNGTSLESRGLAIYEQMVHACLEGFEAGTFVVIDVDSRDYEIDSDDADAKARLIARHPGAVTYVVRRGHPAAYRMGARFSYRPQ